MRQRSLKTEKTDMKQPMKDMTQQEAYHEGMLAWHHGKSETANPFPECDVDNHLAWNDGWMAAEAEDEQ